ncbi:hypothetical protein [Microlunatus flavus]|uniref:Alkaline shock response membrane anchor protein AmaP n=1 Tax=Microlunatus flavus TaxID=1036181 RepID=A0A1H9F0F5_9ACTN|nr:hypothetical protein [Microlunatus flavus]SEQ31349.1 hypothetical protein SAMN05421756_103108 [Microlunatus flavus]
MRQSATRLNRAWLTVLGVLLVLLGAAGLLVSTGQAAPLASAAGIGWTPPDTGQRLFGAATAAALALTWVVVLVALVAVVVALLGLAWLLAQVPRKREAKPFRLHDDAETGLTRVDAGVVADAVEAQLKSLPGVSGASAVLRGSVAQPDLTVRLTVDDRSDIPAVLGRVHREVAGDLAGALDTRLQRLGVQVEVSSAKTGKGQITVTPVAPVH